VAYVQQTVSRGFGKTDWLVDLLNFSFQLCSELRAQTDCDLRLATHQLLSRYHTINITTFGYSHPSSVLDFNMIAHRSSFVFLWLTGLLSVVCGGSLKGPRAVHDNANDNDVANKPVDEEVQRRHAEALNKIEKLTSDHLIRKLQGGLPPLYEPTSACGETIGTVSIAELQAFANTFISALFAESEDTVLADLAKSTLLGHIFYDLRLVKVCMSCAEAEALLPADIAVNSADEYGFQNICAEGSYAVDQVSKLSWARRSVLAGKW
jgi:hypothetical protein